VAGRRRITYFVFDFNSHVKREHQVFANSGFRFTERKGGEAQEPPRATPTLCRRIAAWMEMPIGKRREAGRTSFLSPMMVAFPLAIQASIYCRMRGPITEAIRQRQPNPSSIVFFRARHVFRNVLIFCVTLEFETYWSARGLRKFFSGTREPFIVATHRHPASGAMSCRNHVGSLEIPSTNSVEFVAGYRRADYSSSGHSDRICLPRNPSSERLTYLRWRRRMRLSFSQLRIPIIIRRTA